MTTSCYIETGIEQEIESIPESGYAPFYFPTGGGILLFQFTNETFTQVLSALRNGAHLTYGDGAQQVIWHFLENVEYPLQFCEQIINCMLTDEDTRQSIVNMLLNNDQFKESIRDIANGGNTTTPAVLTKPIVESCDKDVLFGASSYIIDYMDSVNIDMFELIEVGTNDEENVVSIIAAIPVLSETPVEDAVGYAQGLLEQLQENYEAAITTAIKDRLKYDIMCRAEKEGCKITLSLLIDYFQERAGAEIGVLATLQDVLSFIIGGDWPGEEIVDMAMLLQLSAYRFGSTFLGVPLYGVEVQAQLGANNPSNAWELLPFDDCPTDEECKEFSFDTSLSNLTGVDTGIYVRKGQNITITSTGTYFPTSLMEAETAEGRPVVVGGTVLPSANVYSLLARVGTNPWHFIGDDGSFAAETNGKILVVYNDTADNGSLAEASGSLDLEICVPPLGIVLEKTGASYILKLISENAGEPIYELETITTGHYVVFSAVEINATTFYIKSAQRITASDEWLTGGRIGLGIGNVTAWWNLNNLPRDFASTVLAIQHVTAGVKIRFTLTATPGTTGLTIPYT